MTQYKLVSLSLLLEGDILRLEAVSYFSIQSYS